MMKLTIKAAIQIQKPKEEVFEAIADPDKMKHYFISQGSARLEEGGEVLWQWPEFPEVQSLVNQIVIRPNSLISFVWDKATTVRIELEEQADESVVVRISEGEKELSEENLKWFAGNTEGWANFLACLKAYLEYGINLRRGAFEFMRKN